MSQESDNRQHLVRMEGMLAGLLRYGALVASGWMALGIVLDLFAGTSSISRNSMTLADRCLSIGIILLVALPVLRVALTTAVFAFEKDYVLAAISGAVLLIIALGFVLGVIDPSRALL